MGIFRDFSRGERGKGEREREGGERKIEAVETGREREREGD
jgi:hypothetical protein